MIERIERYVLFIDRLGLALHDRQIVSNDPARRQALDVGMAALYPMRPIPVRSAS
jgi:hypothetical protein